MLNCQNITEANPAACIHWISGDIETLRLPKGIVVTASAEMPSPDPSSCDQAPFPRCWILFMAFDNLYGRLVVLADDTSSIKNIPKIAKDAADPGIECLNSINMFKLQSQVDCKLPHRKLMSKPNPHLVL